MNKTIVLFLVTGVVLIVAIGFVGYTLLFSDRDRGVQENQGLSTTDITLFPSVPLSTEGKELEENSGTVENLEFVALPASDGGEVLVRKETIEQPEELREEEKELLAELDELYPLKPDLVNVAGGFEDSFIAIFNKIDQSFSVYLLKEPLSESRDEAGKSLRVSLAVTATDVCRLWIFVYTPEWVNSFFDGKNLGLGFCPGAVELP